METMISEDVRKLFHRPRRSSNLGTRRTAIAIAEPEDEDVEPDA